MAYRIPAGYGLQIMTIDNNNGGSSALSTIRTGFSFSGDASTIEPLLANATRDGLKVLWDNGWLVGPTATYFNIAGTLVRVDNSTQEAGTATAADYASPAVSTIVKTNTNIVGRQHRGRIYLPGVPETLINEAGILDATYVNDVQTAMTNWLTAFNAVSGVGDMVLLHDEETPGDPAPDVIASLVVRSVVGTMRPRQRRS
jgi:hypothetical protein